MSEQPTVSPDPRRPLWTIESRKYDQHLHYRLPAYLIEDDGDRLWFQAQMGGDLFRPAVLAGGHLWGLRFENKRFRG